MSDSVNQNRMLAIFLRTKGQNYRPNLMTNEAAQAKNQSKFGYITVMKKQILLLFFGLLSFFGLTELCAQTQERLVKGQITDQRGLPISEVKISINDSPYALSDHQGIFRVLLPLDMLEPQKINIIKEGWKYRVWKEEDGMLKIILKPTPHFLRGRVINEFNMPVEEAKVSIRDETHPAARAVTDDKGAFAMQLPRHIKINDSTRFMVDGVRVSAKDAVFFKNNTFVSIKLHSVQTASVAHAIVYNENMRPVEGIKVLVDGQPHITDEHGEFTLRKGKELVVTDHSEFVVEGYPITKLDYVDIDNYMYIHIKTEGTDRYVMEDSTFLDYTRKFNYVFNQLELEKQLLAEKSNKIRKEIEKVQSRLTRTDLTDNRRETLNAYLVRLERELVENEVAYEDAHEKTNDVLGRLKLLILEKDSLHSVTSEHLEIAKTEHEETRKDFNQKLILFLVIGTSLSILLFNFYRMSKRMSRQKNQLENQKMRLEEHVEEINRKSDEMQEANEEIRIKNETLEVQKEEIEQKNAHITASLTYARRIQRAMLPNSKQIKQVFPDSFVLFKPRDIVSGDFYWFYHPDSEHIETNIALQDQMQNKAIIAVVDCTGHGVPGGFMSMVGDSLLNQIIKLQRIFSPDEILSELNSGIISTLKQDENKNRDGMDLAICTLDLKEKSLEFAGAKNSLVYIQNNELKELKGDKMAIGGLRAKNSTFVKQTLKIDTPTVCYLFSDGYQDQFGGNENRKFMKKHLLQLLLKIHKEPFEIQKDILEETLEAWKNGQRQIDDILLIGFKVNSNL